MEIGDGHLRGRDQIKVIPLDPEKLFFKARQLACSLHGLRRDQVGRENFRIAVFLGVNLQHETDERAFQRRPRPAQNRESRTRKFGAGFKIQNAQRFPEL